MRRQLTLQEKLEFLNVVEKTYDNIQIVYSFINYPNDGAKLPNGKILWGVCSLFNMWSNWKGIPVIKEGLQNNFPEFYNFLYRNRTIREKDENGLLLYFFPLTLEGCYSRLNLAKRYKAIFIKKHKKKLIGQ